MSFSLTCACGRQISVGAGQAGLTVTCDCGRAIEVPSLRELRALELRARGAARSSASPKRAVPVAALLAGLIWTAVGGLIVLDALSLFASVPAVLREKNSSLWCVALFGAGFLLVGWQTIRGRVKGTLALGVISVVLGTLALGGLLQIEASISSPGVWAALALLLAGWLAIRGRERYRSWAEITPPRGNSPAVPPDPGMGDGSGQGAAAPGYREMDRLRLPQWAPGHGGRQWTTVLGLPGRASLSRPYRILVAALVYPAGVVLGFAVIGLWSWSYKVRDREPGPHSTQGMVVAFIATVLGAHGVARRVLAPRAREVAGQDPGRAPVLLLRAFADDQNKVGESDGVIGPWRHTITLEEILTEQLARLGPVVAVGRPGELLPPAGAARLWLDNSAWQKGVHVLLEECQYIVMIMGRIRGRDGLAWEVEEIKRHGLLSKLVLVMPAVSEREAEERWKGYGALLDARLPPYVPFTCFAMRYPSGWVIVRASGEGREPSHYQDKIQVVS